MAEYATAVGFVEFDPDVRKLEGQDDELYDITIRTPGTPESGGGALVRITIWPELFGVLSDEDNVPERGDFVAVSGEFKTRVVGDNTYRNINARRVAVTRGSEVSAGDREVVSKKRAF